MVHVSQRLQSIHHGMNQTFPHCPVLDWEFVDWRFWRIDLLAWLLCSYQVLTLLHQHSSQFAEYLLLVTDHESSSTTTRKLSGWTMRGATTCLLFWIIPVILLLIIRMHVRTVIHEQHYAMYEDAVTISCMSTAWAWSLPKWHVFSTTKSRVTQCNHPWIGWWVQRCSSVRLWLWTNPKMTRTGRAKGYVVMTQLAILTAMLVTPSGEVRPIRTWCSSVRCEPRIFSSCAQVAGALELVSQQISSGVWVSHQHPSTITGECLPLILEILGGSLITWNAFTDVGKCSGATVLRGSKCQIWRQPAQLCPAKVRTCQCQRWGAGTHEFDMDLRDGCQGMSRVFCHGSLLKAVSDISQFLRFFTCSRLVNAYLVGISVDDQFTGCLPSIIVNSYIYSYIYLFINII